jgi:hypothetical protein
MMRSHSILRSKLRRANLFGHAFVEASPNLARACSVSSRRLLRSGNLLLGWHACRLRQATADFVPWDLGIGVPVILGRDTCHHHQKHGLPDPRISILAVNGSSWARRHPIANLVWVKGGGTGGVHRSAHRPLFLAAVLLASTRLWTRAYESTT